MDMINCAQFYRR